MIAKKEIKKINRVSANDLILRELITQNLFLHEINGRVDRCIVDNYNKHNNVNHMYDGRESHFVMDCNGL